MESSCRPRVFAIALWTILSSWDCAAGATAGYGQLITGIFQANEKALKCKGVPFCFGDVVTVNLKTDVVIVSALPPLNFNAYLKINGACKKAVAPFDSRPCVINGQGKPSVFTSPSIGGPRSKLEISNLRIVNTNGAVFSNFWGRLVATNSIFSKNAGAVEISTGLEGGFPGRLYKSCSFIDNNGSAIRQGTPATWRRNELLSIRKCQFLRNRVKGNGGAIALSGGSNASVVSTSFYNNVASSAGGAVFLNTGSASFKWVWFNRNTAQKAVGNDMAGTTSVYGNSNVNLCLTRFPSGDVSLPGRVVLESPDGPSGGTYVNICNTTLPGKSTLPTKEYLTKDCTGCP